MFCFCFVPNANYKSPNKTRFVSFSFSLLAVLFIEIFGENPVIVVVVLSLPSPLKRISIYFLFPSIYLHTMPCDAMPLHTQTDARARRSCKFWSLFYISNVCSSNYTTTKWIRKETAQTHTQIEFDMLFTFVAHWMALNYNYSCK